MTAGSSKATGDSRQLNSSQSAAASQQQQLSRSQSATASSGTTSQQQPAQGQPVNSNNLEAVRQQTSSATTSDNRELNSNQLTTATSTNNFVGPALMINNHRAEGVCQTQCSQHATEDPASATCASPQAGCGTPVMAALATVPAAIMGSAWEHQHNEEEAHQGVNQSILHLTLEPTSHSKVLGNRELRL